MHFFLRKNARHQEDFFKTDHLKASRQKEPGPSYIRVLFYKEPGYMLGSPSTKNQSNFKTRPSSSLFQTARGSGATPRWEYFFLQKKHTLLEDLKKRYMISLKKTLGRRLFLPDKTCRNKTRLPELNHEVLGGLSILGCFCNQERTRC